MKKVIFFIIFNLFCIYQCKSSNNSSDSSDRLSFQDIDRNIPLLGNISQIIKSYLSNDSFILRDKDNLKVYFNDGNLNESFGKNGVIKCPLKECEDATILRNNKILLTGTKEYQKKEHKTVIARLLSNGELDKSFVDNGIQIIPSEYEIRYIFFVDTLSDGSLIVLVTESDYYSYPLKLDINGILDSSFNKERRGIDTPSVNNKLNLFTIQSDDKILLTGAEDQESNLNQIYRFLSDGNRDLFFGDKSKIITNNTMIRTIASQTDGKIIVGSINNKGQSQIARYNNNGNIDLTFGKSGLVLVNLNNINGIDKIIYNNGKILAACGGYGNKIMLIQLNEKGELDEEFGEKGIVIKNYVGKGSLIPYTQVLMPYLNKIVWAGRGQKRYDDMFILRYNKDGTEDKTYNQII